MSRRVQNTREPDSVKDGVLKKSGYELFVKREYCYGKASGIFNGQDGRYGGKESIKVQGCYLFKRSGCQGSRQDSTGRTYQPRSGNRSGRKL